MLSCLLNTGGFLFLISCASAIASPIKTLPGRGIDSVRDVRRIVYGYENLHASGPRLRPDVRGITN